MRAVVAAVLSIAIAVAAAACGHTPPPRSPGHQLALSKCGACHLRPEPGTIERASLATTLERHASRAPMSEGERHALLDYLAPEPTVASRTTHPAGASVALP